MADYWMNKGTVGIYDGCLVTEFAPSGLEGATVMQWRKVYSLDGHHDPKLKFEGQGVVNALEGKYNQLLVQPNQSTIIELLVDKEVTPDSLEYEEGYIAGYKAKRVVPYEKLAKKSGHFISGYQAARFDKGKTKENGRFRRD